MEESGWNSCESGELRHFVDFHHKKLHSDWKDAAEFEARVAAKLAFAVHDCGDCDIVMTCQNDCQWERLKHARLAVEAEMEAESAGR
jgi:radical SAM protein with 4Fe4S-binding SPASM domain